MRRRHALIAVDYGSCPYSFSNAPGSAQVRSERAAVRFVQGARGSGGERLGLVPTETRKVTVRGGLGRDHRNTAPFLNEARSAENREQSPPRIRRASDAGDVGRSARLANIATLKPPLQRCLRFA
jgi:hypothetical protein